MDHLETGIDASACHNTLRAQVRLKEELRSPYACICMHMHAYTPTLSLELRRTGKTVKSLKIAWQESDA